MSVVVEGLVKRFGEKTVLNGISLEVAPQELLAIMGSSGGGKTTLLRCIAGLLEFEGGRVLIAGDDVAASPEQAQRKMGMVFQSSALFDYMTVAENILFGVRRLRQLKPKEARELVQHAITSLKLEGSEGKLPAELSGGMRKRVAFARAAALRPEVMLYDEPTTGLDPLATFNVDELMLEMRDAFGVTGILVSHDLASVVRVADRVAFLHQGELVFSDRPSELFRAEHPAIREMVSKATLAVPGPSPSAQ